MKRGDSIQAASKGRSLVVRKLLHFPVLAPLPSKVWEACGVYERPLYLSPNRAGKPWSPVSPVLYLSFSSSGNWVALQFILCGFILHFHVFFFLRQFIGTFMDCWERLSQVPWETSS